MRVLRKQLREKKGSTRYNVFRWGVAHLLSVNAAVTGSARHPPNSGAKKDAPFSLLLKKKLNLL